jgi:hypothetical protein
LVTFTWRDLDSLPRAQAMDCAFDLHVQFAIEHVKKLSRSHVKMALLARTWWHPLLDHA